MPTFSRHASVKWQGSIMEGQGELKAGTGAFAIPVSFPRRIGDAEGTTSPEELLAAAHATCYAMVISGALGRANATTTRTTITSTVTADKGDAGIKIVKSDLIVVVEGLTGMDAAAFDKMAKEAEGKCPVSNALRGSMDIHVTTNVR